MLHDGLVFVPEVVERSPSGLSIRQRVGLNPPPTGIVVEVVAGVNGAIQGLEDGAGNLNARLGETNLWGIC